MDHLFAKRPSHRLRLPTLVICAALGAAPTALAQVHCQVDDPTGTPLNIRAAPETGKVVGTVQNGSLLLSYAQRGDWRAVAFVPPDADWIYFHSAWVFASHLSCQTALVTLPANSNGAARDEPCRVEDRTGTPLNLRSGPAGARLGALPNGFWLRPMALRHFDGGPWVEVIAFGADNGLGWAYGPYLSCEG